MRERLEKTQRWLEPLGLGVHGSGFFFGMWRKLGLNWAIALTLGFVVPLSEYSLLNLAMRHGVPLAFGDFGVRFEAESWDLHLFGLRGTAHKVKLSQNDRAAPVLAADEVEFNATLGALVGRLFDRPQVFDSITVRNGELHLEQSLSGEWNWITFLESVPRERREEVARGQYQTRALVFDRVRVVYVENIPADSGGGVIQTAQARLFVDDVEGDFQNLVVPKTADEPATLFRWKGRSADGIVDISGRASFFPPAGQGGAAPLSTPLLVKVYLENIGMGAYGRMVATTSLLPVRGTVRGTIDLGRTNAGVTCVSNLVADGVQFAPNPRVVLAKAQYQQLDGDLRGYKTSGAFNPCGDDYKQQHASALLASFNAQTTADAPAAVKQAAARDENSFGLVLAGTATTDVLNRIAGHAGQRLGTAVGGQTGQALQDQQPNAVAKGVRSVGKGFKKLFGK